MNRLPLPPFNEMTAIQKVRMAEDAWNTHDTATVVLAYTPRLPLAEPDGIFVWSGRDRGVPGSQIAARA
jgi:hypothetical protein